MQCDQIHEQFVGYLAGTLRPGERREVEHHLAECSDCATAIEVWNKLGDLSSERPSAGLKTRFQDMLWENAHAGPLRKASVMEIPSRRPIWTWAAAAGLLVAGWLGGRYAGWPPQSQPATKSEEVATLRREVRDLREAVVVSMLRQTSATDRLQGVLTSSRIERPDSDVVGALIETLRHDPSMNVRLSAVDALKRFATQPKVRQGFVEALSASDSPLVQIALIDALVEAKDTDAAGALRQLESETGVEQIVKQRAKLALERLSPRNE
jgi:hypothetical protein